MGGIIAQTRHPLEFRCADDDRGSASSYTLADLDLYGFSPLAVEAPRAAVSTKRKQGPAATAAGGADKGDAPASGTSNKSVIGEGGGEARGCRGWLTRDWPAGRLADARAARASRAPRPRPPPPPATIPSTGSVWGDTFFFFFFFRARGEMPVCGTRSAAHPPPPRVWRAGRLPVHAGRGDTRPARALPRRAVRPRRYGRPRPRCVRAPCGWDSVARQGRSPACAGGGGFFCTDGGRGQRRK